MDLTRIGANRKELRSIAFAEKRPSISIDANSGSIELVVRYADGMGTQGQYDYTITLATEDLIAILDAISRERSAFQPGKLQNSLESSAGAILRLLSAASTLPFQLAPTEAQLKMQAARERMAAKKVAAPEG
jgi:hypothetical protein